MQRTSSLLPIIPPSKSCMKIAQSSPQTLRKEKMTLVCPMVPWLTASPVTSAAPSALPMLSCPAPFPTQAGLSSLYYCYQQFLCSLCVWHLGVLNSHRLFRMFFFLPCCSVPCISIVLHRLFKQQFSQVRAPLK